MAHIDLFFSTLSPYAYLAGTRAEDVAKKHRASITYTPLDIMALFPRTGGTAPKDRHPSRMDYRAEELVRQAKKLGMALDGGCRVGVFMQKMSASVIQSKGNGYKGQFMDGAAGSGLDITSGNVVNDQKVVFSIHRNDLRGIMQARLANADTMNVTISVKVEDSMVPVIGMSLKRMDDMAVGAIARQ